jgi:peptidoglycan/LPS O-acetylase OafA/YrhL
MCSVTGSEVCFPKCYKSHESCGRISVKYNPAIDGLRAVAVLPVVMFHAFPHYTPGGFIGVDVFFVISGFLISGLIFDGVDRNSFSLVAFYAARIRRIFPALLVVLAAVFVAGWWLLFPIDMIRLGHQIVASAAFAANIYFWSQAGYFGPDATTYSLLHLWSLGVEEQFYVVWPLAIMLLSRRSWAILPTIVIIAAASFLFSLLVEDRAAAFYLPMSRAWELMLGAGLAWLMRDSSRCFPPILLDAAGIVGLLLILGSIVCIHESDPYPGWRALAPTIGACLVLWSGSDSRAVAPLLSWRPLVFVGLISYPLYMWHWPVFWIGRTVGTVDLDLAHAAALGAISFVLAWATFVLVERPIRFGTRRSRPVTPVWLAVGLASVTLVGQVSTVSGFPGRWPSEVITLLTYKFDDSIFRIGKCHLKPEQGPSDFASECFSNRHAGARHVVLWGDSAVTALEPGLQRIGKGRLDIDELTTSNCPPFIGDYKPMADRPHCSAINEFAFSHIRTSRPDIVIISFSPSYDTDLPSQAANTVRELRKFFAGPLLVVGPPPLWPKAFPELLLNSYLASPSSGAPRFLAMPPNVAQVSETLDETIGKAVLAERAIYLSATRQLCHEGQCVAMAEGEPVTWDRFHLTMAASAIVARAIYAAIGG